MMNHLTQWNQIQTAFHNQRIPQSILFIGPLHCGLVDFARRVMQLFFCKLELHEPCGTCIDCQMIERVEHPDVEWIKPDKNGGSIKIDQIRALQNSAYLTPQRSQHRVIVIEAADRMNTASANALLKILEEPASHTVFILIAQQLSTVLPTILSRCQKIYFSSPDDAESDNLLKLATYYAPDSQQAIIINQSESLLDGLINLIERKEHPCALAAQWSQYELSILLWFLSLVYSQLQYMYFTKIDLKGPAKNQFDKLLLLLNPMLIFKQVDKLNNLIRKLSHNININSTLVLESLLFSLVESD